MKKGRGESKGSRRITMSVTAAISPYESNWRRRGGCLGFLVYLFSVYHYLNISMDMDMEIDMGMGMGMDMDMGMGTGMNMGMGIDIKGRRQGQGQGQEQGQGHGLLLWPLFCVDPGKILI
jgi:hypothetical protein